MFIIYNLLFINYYFVLLNISKYFYYNTLYFSIIYDYLLQIFGMFAFGVCFVSVSYTESYAVTLLLFCICTAAHGAYHSTVVMNPNDILPHHSGLAFGEIT